MEKYGVATNHGEKLASMKKVGYCTKCKAPVFGDVLEPQKTCDCSEGVAITFGRE